MTGEIKRLTFFFPDANYSTVVAILDESSTLNDVLRTNGLASRDGSFRLLSDSQGMMINHQKAHLGPNVVRVEPPKNVTQIWIDHLQGPHFAPVQDHLGRDITVLGGVVDTFTTAYITSWKRGEHLVGYQFSPQPPYYSTQGLVFLQVPLKGATSNLYNPETGLCDHKVKLECEKEQLDAIRGLWSAWEITGHQSVRFREDITPIPKEFTPYQPKARPGGRAKSRNVEIGELSTVQLDPPIHRSRTTGPNSWPVLVCGSVQISPSPKRGVLVAKSNQSRPNMVNLEGFSYGMTQFIKIPEQGRTVTLHNPMMKEDVECTLINNEEYPLDDYRGRWAIVQLKRHTRYKRALRIVGFPRDFHKRGGRTNE